MAGPLAGFKIIELAGIGPGPFCGMMLADMGADVIRVDRPNGNPMAAIGHEVLFRNRRSIAIDMKTKEGIDTILTMCESADAIFEGFRPGVVERLGIAPSDCMARNPKLVYGRMTGWGQTGPLAQTAGHDINYISLSGALHACGRAGDAPVPPLNLVGDFGGGGMMLAFGLVCALLEAQKSGLGQVVDSSMVEGSAALMAMFFGLQSKGLFNGARGTHMLDTGAHFYEVYETKDGQWMSVGAIEPQFYQQLYTLAELPDDFLQQLNSTHWADLKAKLSIIFKQKTRDEWCAIFDGTDACVTPVLSINEAITHPHNVARQSFVDVDGLMQPAPSPRFSRTVADIPKPVTSVGSHSKAILLDYGFAEAQINHLVQKKAVFL